MLRFMSFGNEEVVKRTGMYLFGKSPKLTNNLMHTLSSKFSSWFHFVNWTSNAILWHIFSRSFMVLLAMYWMYAFTLLLCTLYWQRWTVSSSEEYLTPTIRVRGSQFVHMIRHPGKCFITVSESFRYLSMCKSSHVTIQTKISSFRL